MWRSVQTQENAEDVAGDLWLVNGEEKERGQSEMREGSEG